MAYIYPANATNNVTDMFTLFQYIQEVSTNWFFLMVAFGIFIITFISLKNYSSSRAFAGSSFLFMIMLIFLRVLGFVSNMYMYLSIIMVAIGVVWLHLEG